MDRWTLGEGIGPGEVCVGILARGAVHRPSIDAHSREPDPARYSGCLGIPLEPEHISRMDRLSFYFYFHYHPLISRRISFLTFERFAPLIPALTSWRTQRFDIRTVFVNFDPAAFISSLPIDVSIIYQLGQKSTVYWPKWYGFFGCGISNSLRKASRVVISGKKNLSNLPLFLVSPW